MKFGLKLFFVFCLLNLCSGKVFSETTGDSSKAKPYELKKIIFSIEGAPQYCYRFMYVNGNRKHINFKWDGADNLGQSKPDESYNIKNDNPGTGFFAGIYGNAKLYKGLRLKFGFTFENFQYGTGLIDTFYVFYPKSYNNKPAYTVKFIDACRVRYEYNFLTMPIALTYCFKVSRKMYVNVDMGIALVSELSAYEIKTGGNSYRYVSSGFDFGFSWKGILNCTNDITGGGSFGINYFVSKRTSVSLAPYFKSSLAEYFNKYTNSGSVKLYSFGAKLGVNF